ncbi:DNA-directed DNA polymerase epsilon, subunit C [Thecaphora frezii]
MSNTPSRSSASAHPTAHTTKPKSKSTPSKKPPTKKTASSSSSSSSSRPKGTSIFPIARVQRIIKADRDVDICSREATFLISMATELFVKKFTDEAYTNARLDKRKVVGYKDLSKAVQQNDYLDFLKEVVPTPLTLSAALAERQAKQAQVAEMEAAILAGTLSDGEDADRTADANQDEANDDDDVENAEDDDGDQEMEEAQPDPPVPQRPAKKVKSKSRSSTSATAPSSKATATSSTTTPEKAQSKAKAKLKPKPKSPTKRTARQSAPDGLKRKEVERNTEMREDLDEQREEDEEMASADEAQSGANTPE